MKRLVLVFLAILTFPLLAAAQAPEIFFSDITRGPNSGNSDTTYSATGGAYVTIYGNYLTGFSSITLGGASCLTVVKPPAAWMWYQRMVVKIGTGCSTGNWSITTPNGTFTGPTKETVLEKLGSDFTVATGHTYYISTTGNDSTGTGSFSAPWLTPYHAKYQLADGDIMYGENGVTATTTDPDGAGVFTLSPTICGTSIARTFATYPGATVTIGTTSLDNAVRPNTNCAGNYVFSGITFRGQNTALDLVIYNSNMTNIHVVGTDISCPQANQETGCIQDGGNTSPFTDSGMVYLGNNLHDVGTGNNGLQHAIYHGDTFSIIDGWNTISNVSGACRGIQVYTSTANFLHYDVHLHDNIIHDTFAYKALNKSYVQ